MAYSEANKKAVGRYMAKNYYSQTVRFPKEMEIVIRKAGRDSVNKFIQQAVYEKLERMGYELPETDK